MATSCIFKEFDVGRPVMAVSAGVHTYYSRKVLFSVENHNYSLDKNLLYLKTECGEYKFQISGETGQADAERIAKTMTGEMEKAGNALGRQKKPNPYVKLLLANLNLADRYVKLQNRYDELLKAHENLKIRPVKPVDRPQSPESPPLESHEKKPPVCQDDDGPGLTLEFESSTLSLSAAEPAEPSDLPLEEGDHEKSDENTAQVKAAPGPLVTQVLDTLKKARTVEPKSSETPENRVKITDAVRSDSTEPADKSLSRVNVENNDDGTNHLPSLDFLEKGGQETVVDHEAIRRDAELLEQKLGYFGIKGEVMEVLPGPVITTFEYKPAPGIKISKIVNLADDLALALSALSIRIVAPIPGKDVIGIEIPNPAMCIVPFRDVVGASAFAEIKSPAPICLGKDIIGKPVVVGLERMPHLLIAGATGTGKSVALNAMICSILYKSTPDQVKFIMIDPKRIELSLFNDIPHLITPVITDMKKANIALQWVVREMEQRYEKLAQLSVRNIEQYNKKIRTTDLSHMDDDFQPFPYIVVIIDELADLMMTASKDIEFSLTRIAQMARAAGIHMILATQRPSVDVLTGIIKANFPTRISFQVSSKTDSRTIIDANGAETLLGRGDMLFVPPGTARLKRVHGTYLSERELGAITEFVKAQGKPEYISDVTTEKEESLQAVAFDDDEYDEKYQQALDFVMSTRQASISGVQRALRIGYNRAARIIDLMEKQGIVAPSDGVRPRQVIGSID
ncbi:DNA translocase FtsK [Desulfobacter curvatus]|uniref:DNA translocase FtsK n=1 Tax=Desulfobacter curvatus TaxID=2290 RepID=UPI000367DAA7|nr:DNA translocase FtsK [Desulfobacter curvatus]